MSRAQEVLFRRGFSPAWYSSFRQTYETINPDRPLESAAIRVEDCDPAFLAFLERAGAADGLVEEFLPQLGLFLHGPFPLPESRVTRSAWDCRGKRGAYEACDLPGLLSGARVLDVGCNAGYDSFLMASYGAIEVLGLEPHGFYHQAMFLNAVYGLPNVRFMKLGWEDLDGRYFSGFDVVNCQGLLYHVKEPGVLLERLARVMHPGSHLVLETHVLSESTTASQFIEGAFWGDETYWWIPGEKCLEGMLRSYGFKDVRMPLKADCDSRNPRDSRVTVEGHPAGARAWFVATRC